MQAPRGLSVEEKRVKLLEIFHESKDFYQVGFWLNYTASTTILYVTRQLKELEKLGPKLKGIVSQTVKEILHSLVDDDLVQADKIGSSNFFWSFPSQHGTMIQNRFDALKSTHTTYEAQLTELRSAIETERALRPPSDTRTAGLERLRAAKKELTALEEELEAYNACDPTKMEEKKRAVTIAHEAAIRWTDNYSILLSYFVRQTGTDPGDVRKYLEIGDDYEDIY
ncbi:Mnd1 family-domain-containing protein [Hygrophoropsis aurantiaca]|uniref:Mnd1 family-domain-containing protein n=1 Tax=Hygrophoropsis aurantiaca TaxID=72124 RepID=A0ACB8ALQ8_9AGAM|nr:Mnd1 family-domain-containing protein [Hygrophoropsis aurantiaca]